MDTVVQIWRRLRAFVLREARRVRRDWRPALAWSMRVSLAATASYVVATLIFPGTQPLLAPLTAMLVVQVTPVSLLTAGLDRVVAVVSGVSLAVGFSTVVPLEWWSLGLLILAAITIGQFLRLRNNLIEVAISAMLVLGVGSLGAGAAASQRISETLVGAAVGILANLVFPPKVATADASQAIDGVADALDELLNRAARELDETAAAGSGQREQLATMSRAWLDDARKITTHLVPQVGAALIRAEEGRRFNLRAARAPLVEPGLRQGLEALEHSAVAIRSLMRAVADASEGTWLDEDGADAVLTGLAESLRQMATGLNAFGELVRNEGDVHADLSGDDIARLKEALDGMYRTRARLDAQVTSGPPEVQELRSMERLTLKRLLRELDLEERVRRQLRLLRPRRRVVTPRPARPRQEVFPPAGPDDETQVLKQPRERGRD